MINHAKTKARRRVAALIPQKVSGKVVLAFFETMRMAQHLRIGRFDNLYANAAAFVHHRADIARAGGYIEDQHSYSDLKYGKTTVCNSGCEPIAIYNALYSIGEYRAADLPVLLARFERDGIASNGKFGTSPCVAIDFFRERGYTVELETEYARFDEVMRSARCGILTYFNNVNDVSDGAHTVCITKDGAGGLTLHNAHGGKIGPCATVAELLHCAGGGQAKPIALTGIRSKQTKKRSQP